MFRSYTEKVYRTMVKPQTPHPVEWFSCDLCAELKQDLNSLWRSETDLELHRKDVHLKYIIEQMKTCSERFCTVCMTLQDSTDALITHIKTRHLFSSPKARRVEREIFVCDYCSHVFFNKAVLEAHILYLHMWRGAQRMKKSLICPKCKKLVQLKAMWFHLQQHEIPSVAVCDICLISCRTTQDLKIHLKTHPMHYMCDICNYQTPKEDLYQKHLDLHKESVCEDVSVTKYVKEVFTRPIPTSFQLKYNLQHTFRGLMVPDCLHICVLCREICETKEQMFEHVCRDHVRPLRPYKAPRFRCACGDAFASRVLLKHHAFKLKANHREIQDDMEIFDHESNFTNEDNDINKYSRVYNEINQMDDQNETSKEIGNEWQVEPTEELETQQNSKIISARISDNVTLTSLDALSVMQPQTEMEPENNGDELVYIYAAVNDDEMVTIEQDSDQVISF